MVDSYHRRWIQNGRKVRIEMKKDTKQDGLAVIAIG